MSPSADEIVAAAGAWLGTPYRHQAATLGAGCDCLGLVRGVWRTLYGNEPWTVPPYRAGWRDAGPGLLEAAERYLVRADGLEAGRIVLFQLNRTLPARHCGIMVSDSRFIHAQERIGVVAAELGGSWRHRIAAMFAFPNLPSN